MYTTIPCVILCGGKSSRMGEDKSLLPFKNYDTLIHYQYTKLSEIFKNVYISSKIDKFNFKANLIYDQNQEISSPMVALSSIINKLNSDKVFIITVDTPFVKKETIDTLLEKSQDYKITIAKDKNRTHNLCGVFNKSIKNTIDKLIKEDIHKVNFLIKQTNNYNTILFEDELQFINLNTVEDYNKALEISNHYM